MFNNRFDLPTMMVILILILLLIYGMISLIVKSGPDPISFTEEEQRLGVDEFMILYEKKKQAQNEQRQNNFMRFFEFTKDE